MSTTSTLMLETARRGELHHAAILFGPSPAPLRALALRLAKTLNCLNGSTGDDCTSCVRIDRRIHPDVHFVEVSEEKKLISVEQIRDIVSDATLRPYEGRTKVFIIDPADALSVSGSNSLLKTLEEPSRDTTFLMITRSPDLLLPTIRSRSQQIYIGESQRTLTGPRQLARIREVALFDEGEDLAVAMIDLLHRYATREEGAALLALSALIADQDHVKDALALLGMILCDAMALSPEESIEPDKLSEIGARISRERLLAAADASMAAVRWVNVNADSKMLAESIVAALVTGPE